MSLLPIKEDRELTRLQTLIRETPVEVDLVERTMERYTRLAPGTPPHRTKGRGALWTAAAVLTFIIALTSTSFVSPTMAESLKKIPGISSLFQAAGDLGLRRADERGLVTALHVSDKNGDVILQVPTAMFDGSRVSIGIERQSVNGLQFNDVLQSSLMDMKLLINGEPLQTYAASEGNTIGIYMNPGQDQNSTILQFSDLKNQGGKEFPDKFELTLQTAIAGIDEPFELKIPVEKYTGDNVILSPDVSSGYGDILFTVEKVELTPITTDLTIRVELPAGKQIASTPLLRSLGYDLFDENGRQLKLVSGNGWNASGGNAITEDIRFEPFASTPKSITIKPFRYVYQEEYSQLFKLDPDGNPVVDYIPELEITLPVSTK